MTVNTISANLGMPVNSGEPKVVKNLVTSFVCTLLMGGRMGLAHSYDTFAAGP